MMVGGMSDLPRDDDDLGMRLLAERPPAPAAMRGRISRVIDTPHAHGEHLGWAASVAPALLGLLLLAVAALGVAGVGPAAS